LTTPKALNVLLSALAIEASKTPYDLVIEGIPSLDQVYPSKPEPSYIDVSSDDLGLPRPDAYMNAVEIWLHSSGTTGLPKAIPLSHEYLHKLKFSRELASSILTRQNLT
jgi:acyl-CoA synthetase (AMP-forming)/AMP-acid ligase II